MNYALFKNFSCQFSFEKQLVLSLFRSHANILSSLQIRGKQHQPVLRDHICKAGARPHTAHPSCPGL